MALHRFDSSLSQMSAEEFIERKKNCNKLQMIDVREPEEVLIASLEGFTNLPLSQFNRWSGQIHKLFNPSVETVVMCHHGVRSAQVCHWLIEQRFTNVKNLSGGINAYSEAIDGSVPQY